MTRKLTIGPGYALWTDKERQDARALLLAEHTFSEVDEKLGRARGSTYQAMRAQAGASGDWNAFERLKAAAAKGRARRHAEAAKTARRGTHVWRAPKRIESGGGRPVAYVDPEAVRIDPGVLAERERALEAEPDLTRRLMGDPLPGRSALDRMKRQA